MKNYIALNKWLGGYITFNNLKNKSILLFVLRLINSTITPLKTLAL